MTFFSYTYRPGEQHQGWEALPAIAAGAALSLSVAEERGQEKGERGGPMQFTLRGHRTGQEKGERGGPMQFTLRGHRTRTMDGCGTPRTCRGTGHTWARSQHRSEIIITWLF
jgi:hypothetical protein